MDWLRRLSDTLTLDEIGSLTESEMVRRRFDASNTRWAGFIAPLAFGTAFVQLMMALFGGAEAPHLLPMAIAHFLFAAAGAAAFSELAMARRRKGVWKPRLPLRPLALNPTPWLLTFVVVEFVFVTSFREPTSEAAVAWGAIVPWLIVPLRLDLSRRLALHVSLVVIVAMSMLILGHPGGSWIPPSTAIAFVNGLAVAIGAWSSRSVRRKTIEEWSERKNQAREQLRMRDELRYARDVQMSMLPESDPGTDWIDVAGVSLPATEVGGDYYDYFEDEDSLTVVCGDVAGHGLACAIVLASLRSGFTLLRDSLHDPAAVLRRLSVLVSQTSRHRMLATAVVVRLGRLDKRATIASAGHPPAILVRAGAAQVIELFAPPLGVRLPFTIPSQELELMTGDVLLLHSDGLYETLNPAGESYGLERLAAQVAAVSEGSSPTIRDAIVADVGRFRGPAPQDDDMTLVVVRVR
jgi:hypothetical protein